ncbi:hypothetical protein O3M35_005933 [Rhynocoris fuscipes]|uniref:Secreted protein n=1 Tax=Rhynocoris fuscipes TaxID=488301 RepID=A0AAW1DH80_9HEMI
MKTNIYLLLIIILNYNLVNGMLVKSWGTGVKINWLRWSINDIFNEALQLMTLGQKAVYPVDGFRKLLNSSDRNLVQFETYNGWLEDLQLEVINRPGSDLRRVVMTRAERYLHEKAAGIKDTGTQRGHQHEMIICFECMALSINRVHYAYRTEMNSTEDSTTEPILLWTAGTLENDQEISIPITFQMSIMVSQVQNSNNNNNNHHGNHGNPGENLNTNSKKQCIILMEPLQLTTSFKWWPITATRIGRFNFLADHIDQWLERHFLNSTIEELRTNLDKSVRKILHTRNICLEILLKDSDYVHDE